MIALTRLTRQNPHATLSAPSVSSAAFQSPSKERLTPAPRDCSPRPTCSDRDPNQRRPHGHHPFRTLFHWIAIAMTMLLASCNAVQNWPQEWLAIKNTVAWIIVVVIVVLHHFGIAMSLIAP